LYAILKDDYRKKSRRRASHFNRDSPLRILSRRAGSSISLFKESQSTRGLEKRMGNSRAMDWAENYHLKFQQQNAAGKEL
jgi:hypothetical protein